MSSDAPLYQRNPAAWEAHLAEGNATQARKRVSADVLLRDNEGRILLVDPRYKPDWDLPGGMAESNEPPDQAAERELQEELDLELRVGRLLCVDWVAPHGPWDDLLAFVFDGGELGQQQIADLRVVDGELTSFEFCARAEAERRLRPYVWRRVTFALDALTAGQVRYLRGGCAG